MLESAHPVVQGLLGTLFTWFVTALGAGMVFFLPTNLTQAAEGRILDAALGFAGGVMLAASFWSLLAPALEISEETWGVFAFFPVSVGFVLGAGFVFASDTLLPHEEGEGKLKADEDLNPGVAQKNNSPNSTRRIMLLLIAVVLHNFPEGMAVGVGFGGIGLLKAATFEKARTIAFGIGLQNFPEGLAVSLPLIRLGWSRKRAFFYGQLSGMVEPLGGLLGAGLVQVAAPLLPYMLAFAAGAMVYVVIDSVVPESQARGNRLLASWGGMVGFIVMMSMDVALG
ncbi:hypothetical protein BASA81_003830 [Batrachochytrium salamandrivorans]|nr:hypothetical protein BASA81_003830 [Batrachochytrium salamandrivorans]